ncbi:unnamed protein product [Lasius platythorax]|uniref:PB1 domain-containing protein n=1 Tax=Lasius platythorax TaxID=488582 RepID=A0AAV2NVM3_9HYME
MATLSFKAYLWKEKLIKDEYIFKVIETRIFKIKAKPCFSDLYNTLQGTFPDLSRSMFTITWRDEEDDSITISSDKELMFALKEMTINEKEKDINKTKIHKLNVYIKKPKYQETY